MQEIRAAPDERTFYGLRSMRFEKLSGGRKGQCSMRLNDQWRLIVSFPWKGSDEDDHRHRDRGLPLKGRQQCRTASLPRYSRRGS